MMTNQPTDDRPWRLLEHTADIRLEVRGATIEDLFVNAALGLAALLAEYREVEPHREEDLLLEAETIDDLLVDWLRELLYLHETTGFVFLHAAGLELTGTAVKARVLGREMDPEEVPPSVIKAVTYHDVSVERTDRGYVTRVVFDI